MTDIKKLDTLVGRVGAERAEWVQCNGCTNGPRFAAGYRYTLTADQLVALLAAAHQAGALQAARNTIARLGL